MGSIARDVIKQGVDKLANAVKITLGPQGKYVVIEENDGSIHVTKDGVTVAKNIFAEDMYPELNAGISLIREASLKTLANVGDATTTSTILAQSLITHIDSELASLENFIDFILLSLNVNLVTPSSFIIMLTLFIIIPPEMQF